MVQPSSFDELIALAERHQSESDLVFLRGFVYAQALTPQQQRHFLQFINLARVQQAQNPIYETTYHHLLHLYMLNGSRLDLLKTIDRRWRGLVEGQGALLLITGISGIGKTLLVHAFQARMQQLGTKFLPILCSEQESTSFALWQDVAHAASVTGVSLEALLATSSTTPCRQACIGEA
jgi:chromosomal replication initiation ATPase DnaA